MLGGCRAAASRCFPWGRCCCPSPTCRCTSSSPATGRWSRTAWPATAAVGSIDDAPATAAYEAALLSPIGPMDCQRVLEAPGAVARLALLETMLDDARDVLSRRIAED